MRSKPLISIITPAYYSHEFISRSVKSVLQQRYSHWEMLIISDDQTDYEATLDKLKIQDSRIRCLSTGGIATGASNAGNVGLEKAQGELIAILDSDDELFPDNFECMVPKALLYDVAFSAVDFCCHQTLKVLPNFNKIFPAGLLSQEAFILASIHGYSHLLYNRKKISHRWDPRITAWTDLIFALKAFDQVDHFYYEPRVLHRYYRREGSICNRPNSSHIFIELAQIILSELDSGVLDIKNGKTCEILKRFMRSRIELEAAFEADLKNGLCKDYQDYIGMHPQRLYYF